MAHNTTHKLKKNKRGFLNYSRPLGSGSGAEKRDPVREHMDNVTAAMNSGNAERIFKAFRQAPSLVAARKNGLLIQGQRAK